MTAPEWPSAETLCFAVLPDTQIMAELDPAAYLGETTWLAAHAAELGLSFVLHVGDVVNRGGRDVAQFELAARAHSSLLSAGIPLLVAAGNHDYDDELESSRALSLFNQHVGFSALGGQPWFGGTMIEGASENAYAVIDSSSGPVLIVVLEFGPRPEVAAWFDDLVVQHAELPVFVVTHSFLDPDGHRTSTRSRFHPRAYQGSADGLDAEQLWTQRWRRIPNLVGVFSGHQVPTNVSYRVDVNDAGLGFLQSFQNWQMAPLETMARIRLVWWRPSTRQVRMRVVDTALGSFVDEPGFEVDLVLDAAAEGTRFPSEPLPL